MMFVMTWWVNCNFLFVKIGEQSLKKREHKTNEKTSHTSHSLHTGADQSQRIHCLRWHWRESIKSVAKWGKSGQKEKLSYLSLARQIELGPEKGHTATGLWKLWSDWWVQGFPWKTCWRVDPHITCRHIERSLQIRGQDVYFSPDMLNPPPDGVVLSEVMVQIPERKVPYVPIRTTNTTNHNIYLECHKITGHLVSVKTVQMADTPTKEKPTTDMTNSLESNKATSTSQPTFKPGDR